MAKMKGPSFRMLALPSREPELDLPVGVHVRYHDEPGHTGSTYLFDRTMNSRGQSLPESAYCLAGYVSTWVACRTLRVVIDVAGPYTFEFGVIEEMRSI